MAEKKDQPLLDITKAKSDAGDFSLFASLAVVDSEEAWVKAREKRRAASLVYSLAEKHYKLVKEPHRAVLKEIVAEENEIKEPLDAGFEALDQRILDYEQELIRERAEIQTKMQEDARARALADQESEALRLDREGLAQEAAKVRARTPFVPTVVLPEWNPFLPGEGRLEVWGFEVDDFRKLVEEVAAGRQPLNLLMPNEKVLTSLAKAMKQTLNIPGVSTKHPYTITQR